MKLTEKLTKEDIKILNTFIKGRIFVLIISISPFFTGAGLVYSEIRDNNGILPESNSFFLWSLLYFAILISAIFLFFKYLKEFIKARKDRKNGLKEVLNLKITSKGTAEDEYYLMVKGENYKTDKKNYELAQIGQEILVYVAPLSKHILKVELK